MPSRIEDWAQAEERLRLSLFRGFRGGPHLAEQEMVLHGPFDRSLEDHFRGAMLTALQSDATLADEERSALQPLTPERWEEVRASVQSHLSAPTAIPDQDLAVYLPPGGEPKLPPPQPFDDQLEEIARLAQETVTEEVEPDPATRAEIEQAVRAEIEQAARAEIEQATRAEIEQAVRAEIEQATRAEIEQAERAKIEQAVREKLQLEARLAEQTVEELHKTAEVDVEQAPPRDEVAPAALPDVSLEPVEWDLTGALDPKRLTPLPLVTAALEAVGLDEKKFGFLLRYGTFAPEGRKSEIKVGGLGLADFSRRAADWFDALGAARFPIQVIDEGSGELTVYLLEGGPS